MRRHVVLLLCATLVLTLVEWALAINDEAETKPAPTMDGDDDEVSFLSSKWKQLQQTIGTLEDEEGKSPEQPTSPSVITDVAPLEVERRFRILQENATGQLDLETATTLGDIAPALHAAVGGAPAVRVTALWQYCDGTATVSEKALYKVPGCHAPIMQTPKLNRSTGVEYTGYQLKNLSFCCKSNYTSILPVGTDIHEKDREAEYLFEEAKMGLLSRHPCDQFYPYHTCDPCLYAYRTWVCAITFPAMCQGSGFPNEAIKICNDVCDEVLRKCPVDFGVACPSDGTIYGRPSRTSLDHALDTLDPSDPQDGVGVSSVGCNLMHYDLYARTGSGSYPVGGSVVANAFLLLLSSLLL